MFRFFYLILFIFVTFGLIHCPDLNGETSVVDSYKKQEKELSRKRFKEKEWSGRQKSDLTQQTFPFKSWEMHYSSLGSKKWDASVQKAANKGRFKSGKIEFPMKKGMGFSEWQGYLTELESNAQISTESTMRLIQDKRIYAMMLQRAENYQDTGELLSLRDINRFQFRKNRPKGDVPVTQAGSGNEGK